MYDATKLVVMTAAEFAKAAEGRRVWATQRVKGMAWSVARTSAESVLAAVKGGSLRVQVEDTDVYAAPLA